MNLFTPGLSYPAFRSEYAKKIGKADKESIAIAWENYKKEQSIQKMSPQKKEKTPQKQYQVGISVGEASKTGKKLTLIKKALTKKEISKIENMIKGIEVPTWKLQDIKYEEDGLIGVYYTGNHDLDQKALNNYFKVGQILLSEGTRRFGIYSISAVNVTPAKKKSPEYIITIKFDWKGQKITETNRKKYIETVKDAIKRFVSDSYTFKRITDNTYELKLDEENEDGINNLSEFFNSSAATIRYPTSITRLRSNKQNKVSPTKTNLKKSTSPKTSPKKGVQFRSPQSLNKVSPNKSKPQFADFRVSRSYVIYEAGKYLFPGGKLFDDVYKAVIQGIKDTNISPLRLEGFLDYHTKNNRPEIIVNAFVTKKDVDIFIHRLDINVSEIDIGNRTIYLKPVDEENKKTSPTKRTTKYLKADEIIGRQVDEESEREQSISEQEKEDEEKDIAENGRTTVLYKVFDKNHEEITKLTKKEFDKIEETILEGFPDDIGEVIIDRLVYKDDTISIEVQFYAKGDAGILDELDNHLKNTSTKVGKNIFYLEPITEIEPTTEEEEQEESNVVYVEFIPMEISGNKKVILKKKFTKNDKDVITSYILDLGEQIIDSDVLPTQVDISADNTITVWFTSSNNELEEKEIRKEGISLLKDKIDVSTRKLILVPKK